MQTTLSQLANKPQPQNRPYRVTAWTRCASGLLTYTFDHPSGRFATVEEAKAYALTIDKDAYPVVKCQRVYKSKADVTVFTTTDGVLS